MSVIPAKQINPQSRECGEWSTHFLGNTLEVPLISTASGTGSALSAIASVAGRPGIFQASCGTTASGTSGYRTNFVYVPNGSATFIHECAIRVSILSTGTERFGTFMGINNSALIGTFDQGAYFYVDEGSGRALTWNTQSQRTPTIQSSSGSTGIIPTAGTWYDLRIELRPGSAIFQIAQGSTILYNQSQTLTLPPNGSLLGPVAGLQKWAGLTNRTIDIDFMRTRWIL